MQKRFEALAYNGNELKMSMIKLKEEPKATEFVEGEQIRLYDQAQHFIGNFVYHENERKFVVEKMVFGSGGIQKSSMQYITDINAYQSGKKICSNFGKV